MAKPSVRGDKDKFESRGLIKTCALFFIVLFSMLPIASAYFDSYTLNYDSNGNNVKDINNYYEYNSLNQLIKIRAGSSIGAVISEFLYDYDGSRVKKIDYNGTQITTTYYLGDDYTQVINSTSTTNSIYYFVNGQIVGEKVNGKKSYYLVDALGSPEVIINETGSIVSISEYLPFGGELISIGGRFGFTGQERENAGIMFYDSRYYSPYLSRFIQPDSMLPDVYDPQQLNRYAYARNNPVKYTDPSGHILDTFLDIGFVILDIANIVVSPFSKSNWIALGLDVVSAFTPFATGLGWVYKTGSKADNIYSAVMGIFKNKKGASKVIFGLGDIGKNSKKASKAAEAASNGAKSIFQEFSKDPAFIKNAKNLKESGKVTVSSFKEANALRESVFSSTQKIPGAGPKMTKASDSLLKGNNVYKTDYLFDSSTGRIFGHDKYNPHGLLPHINIKDEKGGKFVIFIDDFAK